ncbi:MAG: hypothetical protein ACYST6_00385 [Planctomycetota bacterium]|jgi:hypothetical protein
MKQGWHVVLPPLPITALLGVVYLLTYSADVYLIRIDPLLADAMGASRVMLLALGSVLYAYYRVRTFHPSYNRSYREWLCVIPWSADHPLPKGPIRLVWVDVVMLAILYLLAYFNLPSAATAPVIAFLIVYVALLLLTFEADQIHIPTIALFLAPFAIYPSRNVYVAILVLLALYVLCLWGLRQYLKDFPWNTKYWKADPLEELRKQAIRLRVIGWPFKYLNIHDSLGVSFRAALVLSFLLTWWLHVIFSATDEPPRLAFLIGFFIAFVLNVVFFRTFTYAGIYRPPISLLGRIFTGRLIIPRYDKIFLAPICILLAGTLLPAVLVRAGMNPVWSLELSFFVALFLALSLPPKLRDWRLTGPHRIGRQVQTLRPRPPDAREQMLAEFFSAKSGAGK